MDWYLIALKNYVVFRGRARRKEYWYFILFDVLISSGLGLIDGLLGLTAEDSGLGLLGGLFGCLNSFYCGISPKAARYGSEWVGVIDRNHSDYRCHFPDSLFSGWKSARTEPV